MWWENQYEGVCVCVCVCTTTIVIIMNIIIMAWCSAIYGKLCVCHKHEISDKKKNEAPFILGRW